MNKMLLAALTLATSMNTAVADTIISPMVRDGAKPTIKVGDGAVHVNRLQPYDNAWRVTIRKKDGSIWSGSSIWSESLRTTELDGRKVFWWSSGDIVYRGADFSNMQVFSDFNISDAKTLAPIRSWHHFSNDDILHLTFDDIHVESKHSTSDKGPWEINHFDTATPVYNLEGGYWAVLVPLLDLRVGNSGVLPGIGDKDIPVKGYPFRVVRREKIHAGPYGVVDTAVVELYEPRTKELFTFWTTDKPPYVMRFVVAGEDYDQSFDEVGATEPVNWSNYEH